MTLIPDPDTLLQLVLPKLLRMTLLSAVVGGVVGTLVAWIGALVRRRPRRVRPAVGGSCLGVLLLGLLPIEANPASLIGGPNAGIWWLAMGVLFVPGAAVVGAVVGLMAAGPPGSWLRSRRRLLALALVAYASCALVLTVSLSPPPITVRRPAPRGPWPLLAEVRGYTSTPSDLALSADGRQLAVLSVRHGRQ